MNKTEKTAKTFGGRIAQARKEAKLTQEKLGELLNVSKSQISYYESDDDSPSFEKLVALSSALNKSLDFLITGHEGIGGKMIDPDSYELILKIRELPPALKEFVIQAVALATNTRHLFPAQFTKAPTKDTWPAFLDYLTKLSKTLPKDTESER